MDIKIISKRYKNKGKMFHYSHFIRDFLLPFFNFRLYLQNDINRVLLNSAKSQSMEARVQESLALASPGLAKSALEAMEHLAILKRWYYRSRRSGEIFFADEKGGLPM